MARPKSHQRMAMDMLTSLGWHVDICERKITPKLTRDLFGFVDVMAINPDDEMGTLALQVTSPDNVSHRLKKILASKYILPVLLTGWRVEVWGPRRKPLRDGSVLKAKAVLLSPDGTPTFIDRSLVQPDLCLEIDPSKSSGYVETDHGNKKQK